MNYTASKASFFMRATRDKATALVATDYKDPQIVVRGGDGMKDVRTVVRRLTPL